MDTTLMESFYNTEAQTSTENWTWHAQNESTTSRLPLVYQKSDELFSAINFYGIALVIAVGGVCNVISFVVLVGTRMRETTSGIYLAALSVSDTLVLTAEFLKWISKPELGIRLIHRSTILCKIVYHVRYATKLWSAILVTTVCLERYLLVSYPLKVNRFATKKLAKSLILAEFLICAALGSYGSVFFRLVPIVNITCLINFSAAAIYSRIDLIISKVIGQLFTNVAVAVLTAGIIVRLARSRRKRDHMTSGNQTESSSAAERHLTIMLVVMATSFVVLRSPYTITWYVSHFTSQQMSSSNKETIMDDALLVTYVIATMNYAVNFFLYCLAGKKFREQLVLLCCCCCCYNNNKKTTYDERSTNISTVSKDVTSCM
ncbi:hypothetical protein LSH36_455g01024 [Paralvinella palmiformis]|uniref:G-protein coupled receptors family 1 profile domain-containing protein n=1 Tax=Paralvinella palmiformis TaxID=53620 RepID=A0AAD9MXQ5_9ANNE|nr:hypothetical protein LSH36_455g01024 [Paralvinella palmiformis]